MLYKGNARAFPRIHRWVMAAVPALARSPLFAAFTVDGLPLPADESTRLQRSLETLFPDLLVHGTRNALLSMTTSLTKVSDQAHRYFARVSQMLAFERMMRSFMRLTAAVSPFPMDFGAANCWSQMFMAPQPAALPWANFAPTHQLQAPSPWAYFAPQQPQTPPSPWSYLIPAQSQSSAMMQFFANALQPEPTAAGQSQAWPGYNPLFIVPIALLAAAPMPESWWNFGFPN
jgi:hypothetical protein